MGKVVLAGGSGFIGRSLVAAFAREGYEVVVLSRSNRSVPGARIAPWSRLQEELEGAEAVLNLCGSSLLQRWTNKVKQDLKASRIGTTSAIGDAVSQCAEPPRVWVNTSATGYYGDTGGREVTELTLVGRGYLAELCREWEAAVVDAETPQTRKVMLRVGIVLGRESEAFRRMALLTRFSLGGPLGTGRQYVPWIHIGDLTRMFVWAVQGKAYGPINATAPHPVPNSELMSTLRRAYGRAVGLPAPKAAVESVCRTMGWDPAMLLGGTRAVPCVAVSHGFEFQFPRIEDAIRDLVDETPRAWGA